MFGQLQMQQQRFSMFGQLQSACPILMVKNLSPPNRKTILGKARFIPSGANAF